MNGIVTQNPIELPQRRHQLMMINIGTQSVQELFFCDRSIRRTVYSNDLFKFFGCDVQLERNWEFKMYIRSTKSILMDYTYF